MDSEPFNLTALGISVFGSAIIRVEPDIAVMNFAVWRFDKNPKEAFSQAREASRRVHDFLIQANLTDVGTSRITVNQTPEHDVRRGQGYTARVGFQVILRNLDRLEEILVGIIDSGANELTAVVFQTSRLKEIRAEARRKAVQAAREKALIYCEAASVTLGSVLNLEDVNPDSLRMARGSHMIREDQPEETGELTAITPSSIEVAGAVKILFAIDKR